MQERVESLIRQKMESRDIQCASIEAFVDMVRRMRDERSAYVPLAGVEAPDARLILEAPPDPEGLRELEKRGRELLEKVVVIKLNGGRSTTMGGEVPKGILVAKDGLSYLEIIVRQMEAMQRYWQTDIPLVLMNSFFTHDPTMEILGRFDFPILTFVQNQVPRLVAGTLEPVETGTDDDWAPPGHGDLYTSLKNSGMLDTLRGRGLKWAFVSNLDNLAACMEPWIVGLMETKQIAFLLEVTERTHSDRKGGTLIVRNGKLDLLEIAQVSAEERELFMDIDRFSVFNTNNVWVDLDTLEKVLEEKRLRLPIIQNRKRVADTDVIQVETAMGAAIGSFTHARGLRVGRDRFFPTKKVEDLFVLQSDACTLDAMYRLRKNPNRLETLPLRPTVTFAPDFLKTPSKMSEAFEDPASVSLVEARSLAVSGRVFFERDVKVQGDVRVEGSNEEVFTIRRGTILREGSYA